MDFLTTRRETMKLNFDIDCTPEEAREFLGLPDVKPMQAALMKEVQERMASNLQAMDPENLFKAWMPASIEGWKHLVNLFQSQVAGIVAPKDSSDSTD